MQEESALAISIMLIAFLVPVALAAQQSAGADAASDYRFAEDYRGLQVVNAVGKEVGDISRLIMRGDRVTHAVASIRGIVGLGGSVVVLPFDASRVEGDRATIDTLASADQIEKLTLFDPEEFGLSE